MVLNNIGDSAAVLVTVGVLSQFLPAVASLFTIIWLGIRIYESATVQKILGNKEAITKDED